MSAISENIPVINWVRPNELKYQLETAAKYEFLGGIHHLHSKKWLYEPKAIGYASTFFIKLPQMTYWYTALEKLNLLPEYVPALPENFFEIYFSNCPIKEMEGKLKEDNTSYKIYETHSLYLIPPMSLNNLEVRVRAYGRDVLGAQNDHENPLKFIDYWDLTRARHDQDLSLRWEWSLIPNEPIEASKNKKFLEQLEIIKKLQNAPIGLNYDVGKSRELAAFLFFHKIATDESFYELDNARVQDTYEDDGSRMVIGRSSSAQYSGVFVYKGYDYFSSNIIGIAALRKLSSR